MDIDQKIAVLVQTISHQGGRIDAMVSALSSLLHIARATPGLASHIDSSLERQYAALLAQSENTDYVSGFDSVRDMLAKALQEPAEGGADSASAAAKAE